MSAVKQSRTENPRFTVARKGYDQGEVEIFVTTLERRLSDAQTALAEAGLRMNALEAAVQRHEDREAEFTHPLRLSYEAGEAMLAQAAADAAAKVEAAEAQAADLLTVTRAQLARETQELDAFRMAIAAEAADLASAEQRLRGTISRAAAALVEIVDGPGGLGPFSQSTGSLVEFGRLLLAAAQTGALGEVRVELEGDVASATLVASAVPAAHPSVLELRDGPAPQENASNSSSMALS